MSRDNTEGRRLRTVVELIRLGASLNRKDYRGFTALHHAATTGDRALIEALLSKGAKAERDIFGLQPVDVCSLLTTLLVSIHLKFRTHTQKKKGTSDRFGSFRFRTSTRGTESWISNKGNVGDVGKRSN